MGRRPRARLVAARPRGALPRAQPGQASSTRVYTANPALWALDSYPAGFEWLNADDNAGNTFSYLRFGTEDRRARSGGRHRRELQRRRPGRTCAWAFPAAASGGSSSTPAATTSSAPRARPTSCSTPSRSRGTTSHTRWRCASPRWRLSGWRRWRDKGALRWQTRAPDSPPSPATSWMSAHLVTAYYTLTPDPEDVDQQVAFGTSGHRGSSLKTAFNEAHILATTQAICDYRAGAGIRPGRCSWAGTPTASRSRRGPRRSRSSRPTTSPCSSTTATATRRPRASRTRSCAPTRARRSTAAPPGPGRRHRRHAVAQPARRTAGSSTTRPTAGRPTRTPPRPSPAARTSSSPPASRACAVCRTAGPARTRRLRLPRDLRRRPPERRRPATHPRGRRADRRRPVGWGQRRLLG